MTMVIATHEMEFARRVADQICFVHEGRIYEQGTPEQILNQSSTPEAQRFLRRLTDRAT
jgi:polar amino acid transport system ATP-binding protein